MRPLLPLALLIPATLAGCASQQTLDAQSTATSRELDAMKQAYERLADSQTGMNAKLARLESGQTDMNARLTQMESGQALIAGRLDDGSGAQQALDSLRADQAVQRTQLDSLRADQTAQRTQLDGLTGRVDMAQDRTQLDSLRANQTAQRTQLDGLTGRVDMAQETADDAVKIARDSRLVSGKLIDSLLLNESMVLYAYEQPELTAQGRDALDELIAGVKPRLPHVFVEIVGYTDSLGLDSQNRRVALERAESVRRYLHEQGGIPLDRMATISYGDLKPVASNVTYEGRGHNRRVQVRVLK
jgi:outer membrane protein OmpA-like peptidoglycan-associated protein